MHTTLLPVAFTLALTGCFASDGDSRVAEGAAVYELTNGECRVRVVSARAVEKGSVEVGSDCTLTADVESSMKGQLFELLKELP